MKLFWLFGFILFLYSPVSHSAQISEDFSTRTNFASETAVWNQGLAKVHPTLEVINYRVGFTPIPAPVGTGANGVFDNTTYASFSVGGVTPGNVITLDTDTYPTLEVTSFRLDQGWTLRPTGSNPLVIYSLSDVIIEGDIDCSGEDGTNAVGATPGNGGIGHCGGGNGGNGGIPTGNGGNGGDIDVPNVTGGTGGNANAAPVGGGAGGSWNTSSLPLNGPNAGGGFGQAGNSTSDPEFITKGGGAGGGGGGGNNAGGAGDGGGAGGGAVTIHAVRDFILGNAGNLTIGSINVNGGDGGNSGLGGPGGGGGGGSTLVYVGRAIEIYSTIAGGAAQANFGGGGANGGSGRNWFASQTYNLAGTGFYTPAEQAPVDPINARVTFEAASQNVTSVIFDLEGSEIDFNSLTASPVSADFTIEVAGSSDNFTSDDTGYTTNLATIADKRYVRLRASIATTNINNPTMLDSITLDYTVITSIDTSLRPVTPFSEVQTFDFTAAGCGRVNSNHSSNSSSLFLIPLLLIVALRLRTRVPATNKRRH